jgi:HTH-type transcriptional regulator, sugar sensing transcriptional regulator
VPEANESVEALMELGLTGLEAEIYAFLLRESPATGYRVAQAIGKPAANTYKALEGLAAKGAVSATEGASRQYRAAPWEELLSQIERRQTASRERAAIALARLPRGGEDDRVYEIGSRAQVMERARAMIGRAGELILGDLFPGAAAELAGDLAAAASRGTEVVLKVYEPVEVPGARLIVRERGHEIYGQVPGDLMDLSVDGREALLAFLRTGPEGVHQALWTASALLTSRLHAALVHELILTDLKQAVEAGAALPELRAVLGRHQHLHPISSGGPSYRNLLRRFGAGDGSAGQEKKS